jgi:hypothetical protein
MAKYACKAVRGLVMAVIDSASGVHKSASPVRERTRIEAVKVLIH